MTAGIVRSGLPPTLAEAEAYCRRLARSHYENFTAASLLLPRDLRQHFCNIYAYCRVADDLADNPADPQRRLERLADWEHQLRRCYREAAEHPVFVALERTIRQFAIPPQPFLDLLSAFRQDQEQMRYETFDEVLAYCRRSANPVGHLVLYLAGCYDAERARLSDCICTGLQLANFCQDVARDYDAGRIYLCQESCRQFGYDESMFRSRSANEAFRNLLAFESARARAFLHEGTPLVGRVPRRLRFQIQLYIRGGLAVLDEIVRADYDVWSRRPTVGRWSKLRLLASSGWSTWGGAATRTA